MLCISQHCTSDRVRIITLRILQQPMPSLSFRLSTLRPASAMHSMVKEGLLKQEELGNMAMPVCGLSADEQDEVYEAVADLWEVVGSKEYFLADDCEYARYGAGEITAAQLGQVGGQVQFAGSCGMGTGNLSSYRCHRGGACR